MIKTFYILNSFFLPTGYNHMFMVQKIGRGFEYEGFNLKVVSSVKQITDPGFVMISDHPFYYSFGSRNNSKGGIQRIVPSIIQKTKILDWIANFFCKVELSRLVKHIAGKNIVVIAWNTKYSNILDSLDIPIIYAVEHFYKPDIKNLDKYQLLQYKFAGTKNVIPLKFAADIDPAKIGHNNTNKKYVLAYVGDKGYIKRYMHLFKVAANGDWVLKPNGMSEIGMCKIVPTPPYITQEEKLRIYSESMMVLGIHSDRNRAARMVGERVFEAMAYGAVCLTDNPAAVEMTNNSAVLFNNEKELLNLIQKFKNDQKAREVIRNRGFKCIKEDGTWASRARDFIRMANDLYGINF